MTSLSSIASSASASDRRRDDRRDCAIPGVLVTANGETPCTVMNISPGGKGVLINAASQLSIGEFVSIKTEALGDFELSVRWIAHPRYGLELRSGSTVPPRYFEFYEQLSPARILADRMEFIDLDPAARDLVRSVRDIIARELPAGLEKFYAKVVKTEALDNFFSDRTHIDKARNAQVQHWNALNSGELDATYYSNVRRIGETHARIGLEPRWYIGGYAHICAHLVAALVEERWRGRSRWNSSANEGKELGAIIGALLKSVFLDMDVSISVYLDALSEARLVGESEAINRERKLVAASVGRGLTEISNKNFEFRMSDDLPDVYRDLQHNFNTAVDQVESTLAVTRKIAGNVDSGLRELANASDDLSRRTERQAAGLEESSAALKELTIATQSSAVEAKGVEAAIEATRKATQDNADVVNSTVEAMDRIAESSREIGQIINVIDEIAFQTNLLALNAGVEAARAGDAGRGFAVVAAEVRALAQRAAAAAKQIKEMVASSAQHVNNGVQLVGETGKIMAQITEQVGAIASGVTKITSSAHDQAIGLKEVATAVSEMDLITQQNAAMAEQATAACRSLLQESGELSSLISTFTVRERDATLVRETGGMRPPRFGRDAA